MKEKIKAIINFIPNKYWSDPVWSKVIAGIILAILGAIYVVITSIVEKVNLLTIFIESINYLKQSTPINNGLIAFFFIIICYNLIFYVKRVIGHYKTVNSNNAIEYKLPNPIHSSSTFFSLRLAAAFPGQRGTQWYNNPKQIVDRLSIVFKSPILFNEFNTSKDASSQPIWSFRGNATSNISFFKKIAKTKILLGAHELEIKRMAVHIDSSYHKHFIYLEVKGEDTAGVSNSTPENIKRQLSDYGFAIEEFGLFKNKPISRQEYDDGAAVINGKVIETSNTELRIRHLTNYNFLISSHQSPYNSFIHDDFAKEYLNGILTETHTTEQYFKKLSELHVRPF